MNMPKEFSPIFKHEDPGNKKLPACPIKDLPSLPMMRGYIIPFKGEVLIDRDSSQQEPRILAHFDGGDLMETYLEDSWIDFHDYATATQTGRAEGREGGCPSGYMSVVAR